MKTLLTAWDAEVIAVTDPDAAVEVIEAAGAPGHRPVGRLSSPRGNGVAAIRDIRRRFGENIPAILMTTESPRMCATPRASRTSRCSTSR